MGLHSVYAADRNGTILQPPDMSSSSDNFRDLTSQPYMMIMDRTNAHMCGKKYEHFVKVKEIYPFFQAKMANLLDQKGKRREVHDDHSIIRKGKS